MSEPRWRGELRRLLQEAVSRFDGVKHFWFSAGQAARYREENRRGAGFYLLGPDGREFRIPYCKNFVRLSDGREVPYTACSDSMDHGTKWDDMVYLGCAPQGDTRVQGNW